MKYFDVTVVFSMKAENELEANAWVENVLQDYLPPDEEMEEAGLESWGLPFFEG